MDDMGTPGPKHPARKGLAPTNVTPLPGMKMRRFRTSKNKLKDYLFGPEQVEYETPKARDPNESVEEALKRLDSKFQDFYAENPEFHPKSPLAKHIQGVIQNSGLEGLEKMTRGEHFTAGEQEAKIISMGKYAEERNMRKMEKSND